ncbi:MAG: phosphotransferase [Actinomycetaceae bacterium]|nr:phosphotransferase [Arcanobacterium sp.]MDD7505140.1 phosphotransferase [Actinomycetaceae bacterium]MDY6143870.1 phosphotransferase [Arcanobacterium sp.]
MGSEHRALRERQDVQLLTSARAGEMLRLGLAHKGELRSWSVHKVHHRPGAGVSVGYAVILRVGDIDHDLYIVASTSVVNEDALIENDGRTLRLGATRVHIWEYPFDPQLPALEQACTPMLLEETLGEPVDIELIGYRPTRRAVVKIERQHSADVLYAKVLPPKAQDAFERRLHMVGEQLPAPRIVRSDPGMVVMTAVSGVPLSRILAGFESGSARAYTSVLDSLETALDRLPLDALTLPRRPAWAQRARHYGAAAAVALPQHERRCIEVARGIEESLDRADLGALVVTHGDFYEANVYIDPQTWKVSGILDVDSLGPGYRVFDWACLLGHLSVLPRLCPQRYEHLGELVECWRDDLCEFMDPVALCAATAGVVLSLVAGAKRTRKRRSPEAEHRLSVAEGWLSQAYDYAR